MHPPEPHLPPILPQNKYCIFLIKRTGVYFLTEFSDPALNQGRRLIFYYVASHVVKSLLVDEMASEGSVCEDRHEEASVIRGHRVYKSVWTPVVGEELDRA